MGGMGAMGGMPVPGSGVGGASGTCLFVFNLPHETDEAMIYRLFSMALARA
jgi:hypothetical protein